MVLNRGKFAPQRTLVVPGDVGRGATGIVCAEAWEVANVPQYTELSPQQRIIQLGLPRWYGGKEFACQCRRCWFNPWVRKIHWRRRWQPTAVFLLGKFHGHRTLAGYSPCGHKSRTEHTHTHLSVVLKMRNPGLEQV